MISRVKKQTIDKGMLYVGALCLRKSVPYDLTSLTILDIVLLGLVNDFSYNHACRFADCNITVKILDQIPPGKVILHKHNFVNTRCLLYKSYDIHV